MVLCDIYMLKEREIEIETDIHIQREKKRERHRERNRESVLIQYMITSNKFVNLVVVQSSYATTKSSKVK